MLDYAQAEEPAEVVIEVMKGMRPDGPLWRVPVRTNHAMPKRYKYYEKLADIKTRLHDENHVDVYTCAHLSEPQKTKPFTFG